MGGLGRRDSWWGTSPARERFRELGYDNIDVRVGDGTRGWPEAAPFDAIIVAAGGPTVPPALKSQLAIGGHLVIPVGDAPRHQNLLKVTRIGEREYQDAGEIADPNRTDGQNVIRHAYNPNTARILPKSITLHLH